MDGKKKIGFLVFALVIITIPLYLMLSSENVLENGNRHKIRLEGRDPFDPFRGKFLRLNFDDEIDCFACEEGEEVFVLLEKDEDGFSFFSEGVKERPDHFDFFTAKVERAYPGKAIIKLDNLTKYFINEDKAKDAEDVLQSYVRQKPNDVYLAIRVLDGEARLEDIFIEDTPFLEFLEDWK